MQHNNNAEKNMSLRWGLWLRPPQLAPFTQSALLSGAATWTEWEDGCCDTDSVEQELQHHAA